MLFTKTTELGIKTLIYLALNKSSKPVPPRKIAEKISASPTYIQKISNQLVKDNILLAYRGSKGGVVLSKPIEEITLLEHFRGPQGFPDAMPDKARQIRSARLGPAIGAERIGCSLAIVPGCRKSYGLPSCGERATHGDDPGASGASLVSRDKRLFRSNLYDTSGSGTSWLR